MKDTDFCTYCGYYLYLSQSDGVLTRVCRNCSFEEKKDDGRLILEINLKEKKSEGYKILMNEFTQQDPTLPHVDTIKCPNMGCKSNIEDGGGGVKKDVIYIKFDAVNMKYLYICNVCDTQWRSKS
jgi:DNA-directed RNA polymerase subunit M/transcription elongation factor TFIIS